MLTYAITIDGLSKTYRTKRGKKVEALSGLSLQVEPGQVFGFLGPNGAGKSTTIKLLLDLIRPTTGTCRVFGEEANRPQARARIGYLPENPSFYDYLTADEYLDFVGSAFRMNREVLKSRKEEVLNRLDLVSARKRTIRSYSKGMVQRLGLAQTLIHDPDLYILDEPMSGLDPLGRALVKEIIKELKQRGKTVFFSSHITADVEVVCDRLGVIVGGKLRALDSVQNILQGGLEGYIVQLALKDGTAVAIQIGKDRLQKDLEQLWSQGAQVERIEPARQDLETFFLNVVKGAKDGPA